MEPIVLRSSINEDENSKPMHYIYFHGLLEEEYRYDICVSQTVSCEDLSEGIFDVIIDGNEHKATMFLWMNNAWNHLTGLVVYNDDIDGFEYAKRKYKEKPITI